MRGLHHLSGVTFAAFFFLLLTGCEQKPEPDQQPSSPEASAEAAATQRPESCFLNMGWDPWEPYQYRNVQGEVTGLDVEIARAAAEAAGCELRFTEGSWMDLLAAVKEGDVDMLAGATRTPGREAFAEFTAPYRTERFGVFASADADALLAIDSLQGLLESGARVGVVAEYFYGEEISELLDALEAQDRLIESPVAELNHARLQDGAIDAFIEDPIVAARIMRSRGISEIAPTRIGVETAEVAFMLSRQSVAPEEVGRFREGLEQIREQGRLDEIVAAYRN